MHVIIICSYYYYYAGIPCREIGVYHRNCTGSVRMTCSTCSPTWQQVSLFGNASVFERNLSALHQCPSIPVHRPDPIRSQLAKAVVEVPRDAGG